MHVIHVVYGANAYRVSERIREITADDGYAEHDARDMSQGDFIDHVAGVSLFGGDEWVVVHGVSENASLWAEIAEWLPRVSRSVVLVERALDKRTKAYGELKKHATLHACAMPEAKDAPQVARWVELQAKERGIAVSREQCEQIVERAMYNDVNNTSIIDEMRIVTALDQLHGLEGEISQESIDAVLAPSAHQNVFSCLSYALEGDTEGLGRMLRDLKAGQEPYMLLGLLGTQVVALASLVLGRPQTVDEIAQKTGVSAYSLRSILRYSHELSAGDVRAIVEYLAAADERMKTTAVDAWVAVEVALYQIAAVCATKKA